MRMCSARGIRSSPPHASYHVRPRLSLGECLKTVRLFRSFLHQPPACVSVGINVDRTMECCLALVGRQREGRTFQKMRGAVHYNSVRAAARVCACGQGMRFSTPHALYRGIPCASTFSSSNRAWKDSTDSWEFKDSFVQDWA
jgi:hypothetical protein